MTTATQSYELKCHLEERAGERGEKGGDLGFICDTNERAVELPEFQEFPRMEKCSTLTGRLLTRTVVTQLCS